MCLALGLAVGCSPRPRFEAVVLVVIDTLRADHLGVYGYERPTSPQIDAFASRSTVFERAFATSPWTGPSVGSMLTGHVPSRHGGGELNRDDSGKIVLRKGTKIFGRLDESVETLAEQLAAHGYASAAVVTNAVLEPGSSFDRGFATYRYLGPRSRAPAVTDAALRCLDERSDGPFFLMVYYFDPHLPYLADGGWAGRFTRDHATVLETPIRNVHEVRRRLRELGAGDREYIRAAYDEEIAFVDREIGRLLEGLEERGLLAQALVVLTSDHGEELFDHGGFEHGHHLYQELLHVPLVVHAPGWLTPGRVTVPVSVMDVPATVLEAWALPRPENSPGVSLARAARGETATRGRFFAAEGMLYGPDRAAAISWPLKLILGPRKRRALYDLEADPAERRPLKMRVFNQRAAELAAELDGLRDRARAERSKRANIEFDEETRRELGELGYLEE